MTSNPEPAPSPKTLALMCAVHSWADDVDDDSRKLLEWSHDVIESLCARLERQALHLERAEAGL
jgi:hypothetical protein